MYKALTTGRHQFQPGVRCPCVAELDRQSGDQLGDRLVVCLRRECECSWCVRIRCFPLDGVAVVFDGKARIYAHAFRDAAPAGQDEVFALFRSGAGEFIQVDGVGIEVGQGFLIDERNGHEKRGSRLVGSVNLCGECERVNFGTLMLRPRGKARHYLWPATGNTVRGQGFLRSAFALLRVAVAVIYQAGDKNDDGHAYGYKALLGVVLDIVEEP